VEAATLLQFLLNVNKVSIHFHNHFSLSKWTTCRFLVKIS